MPATTFTPPPLAGLFVCHRNTCFLYIREELEWFRLAFPNYRLPSEKFQIRSPVELVDTAMKGSRVDEQSLETIESFIREELCGASLIEIVDAVRHLFYCRPDDPLIRPSKRAKSLPLPFELLSRWVSVSRHFRRLIALAARKYRYLFYLDGLLSRVAPRFT